MRIQHNIMAMNSYRNYSNNTSALAKNLEKLSSGYKINRAGDDAAGLAISEKMRAQISGLNQAQSNAKSGINLVQTAEGALTEVHDMLNRMVTLSEQSANGTYDNDVDRANLQKEFDQLRSEIDRIADSSNFNGINLLDGSLATTKGVELGEVKDTGVDVTESKPMGDLAETLAAGAVDGKLTPGAAETKYSASFYVGDITNNNAAAKNLVFNYADNEGTAQTVTLTVGAGKTVTTENIVNALNGTAVDGITVVDSGKALSATAGEDGKLTELFDISKGKNNTINFKAHNANGDVVGTKAIDSTKVAMTSVTNTFDAADVTAAVKKIKENYDGADPVSDIGYGTASGTATDYAAKVDGNYQVASMVLDVTGKTAEDLHNTGITVGGKTYVIQNGDEEPKGLKGGETVIKWDTDLDTTMGKLAAAISANEADNGYVATYAGGKLTVKESTNRAQDVLNGTAKAGKAADLIKQEKFVTAGGASSTNTVTFDASKFGSGTKLTVGGKNYVFTNDPTKNVSANDVRISYEKGDTSEQLASKFVDALKEHGFTDDTVSVTGDTVTFTNKTSAEGTEISGVGRGLTLQIGDTSDAFNQISVNVQDMHAANLGIDETKINIGTQEDAADAVKVIKNAINTVSSVRGDLGATQNRLDHTINNLSVMTENIQDAESTIRDVDVAQEMMDYTKNNILVQSAQAMLAQANQVPQGVLQLLQ